ncbi:acyl-CoA thioesterase domain-containing protein [Saccharopolyspora sp. NPDC050389]|uniref:acyl-CoA thioesterase domain-containing protein n=1 Tax=Saccharopolyspora sp. NPDC050389 TaxID=3155516 RepID=UPI0034016EE4
MTYFRAETHAGREVLMPESRAGSHWGGRGQLRGTAVSGALARAVEDAASALDDAAGFRPVRWTLDLFRPAAMVPSTTEVSVVRRGRRLRLIDAAFVQDGETVARSSALFLVTGGKVDGEAWAGPPGHSVPDPELLPATEEPTVYYSEGIGWTDTAAPHQNSARKMAWHLPSPIVAGETPTPFQHAAAIADASNLVANWGSHGLEFINADVTLVLTRLPDTVDGIGIAAERRSENDGISTAATTLFDREGPLGTVLLSTLANNANAVDPRKVGM